jgi:hypothetical protein
MPRHIECLKADPYFPKVYDAFVRHIMLEANFFTASQAGRADEPGQTARRNPALPAANCWVSQCSFFFFLPGKAEFEGITLIPLVANVDPDERLPRRDKRQT